MANVVAQMQIIISALTKGMTGPISDAQKSLTRLENAVKGTNKILNSFGVGFGLYQVTGAVVDAVNVLKDFDQQMAIVKAVTGATSQEFNELRKNAIDLGQSTKFTATEIGELQENLAKLGFTTPEILAATKGITALSVATGEDLAKSADVVGSTIRSFGLSATETGRVVDVMADAFNKTALGLENFTEAIKYVAPIAAQAGLSIEETTALLGVLADNGIRGSQAGTSLRKIITDLGTESGDLSTRLQKLAAKGLTGAEAMSEVGRTAYASLLILSKNTQKSEELTTALNNVAGAADKTAAIVGDTLAGDLDKLSSAYDSLILSESGATSALRSVTQAATDFLNALSKKDNSFGQFLDFFGDIISVVPRAAKAISDFFTNSGLSVQELNQQLVILNKVREEAIQRGDRETELKAVEAISKLTNQYKLLAPAVEESNDPIQKSGEQIAKLPEAITPALGLIAQIEENIKKFEEAKKSAFSVSEINDLNIKIQELKDQLASLNVISSPLSGFGKKQLQDAVSGVKTQIDDLTSSTIGGGFLTTGITVPPLKVDAYFESLRQMTQATKDAGVSSVQSSDQMRLAHEQVVSSQQRVTSTALEFGDAIGQAVGNAIQQNKNFVGVIKSVAAAILPKFLAIALGGTIAGAGKTAAPPPVIVALAAAGVAAVSALFKSATGTSGGGGVAASGGKATSNVARLQSVPAMAESITFDAKFRLEGNDLVASANSTNNKNGRLGG